MKAAVINEFGDADVLKIIDVEKPVPNDEEVLIKIMAAGINPVDTKVRAGTSGMSRHLPLPAILGWDVSGVVESAGKDVKEFKAGDAVFGCIGFPGLGKAYAEFTAIDPKYLAKKPRIFLLMKPPRFHWQV